MTNMRKLLSLFTLWRDPGWRKLSALSLIVLLVGVVGWQGIQMDRLNVKGINRRIYVDGAKYPFTAAGIQAALTDAAVSPNGIVILPPTGSLGGSPIAMGGTGLTLPSNVCLEGAGPFSTVLRWTSAPAAAGIFLAAGTNHACVKSLGLSFATSAGASGLRISGSPGASTVSQYNSFTDIYVNFESIANASGTACLWLSGASAPADVSLNSFVNIGCRQAQQMVLAQNCEGNHFWHMQGTDLGYTSASTLWSETGCADEQIDARIESGSGNAVGNIGYGSNGTMNLVTLVVDTALTSTAVNDTGGQNEFHVSMVATSNFLTLGTVASSSSVCWTRGVAGDKVTCQFPNQTANSLNPLADQVSTLGDATHRWVASVYNVMAYRSAGSFSFCDFCGDATHKAIVGDTNGVGLHEPITLGSAGSAFSYDMKGSGTLTYTAIGANACQEQPLTITGAASGDVCYGSPAADIGGNFSYGGCRISGASTAQLRVCSGAGGTPSAQIWNGWARH